MTPKVSIIILNWKGLEDTSECLKSLQKIDYNNYEVIVVDNNSEGEDVKVIKEKFGSFIKTVIVNNKNLGFSGGNNVGIKFALESNTDYILLLNNDTTVEPDFLSELVKKSNQSKNIGILTPMINYYSENDIIWCAGGYISKFRGSGFAYGYNKNFTAFKNDHFCDFASGCCMLIDRKVFEKVGLLDENYFLYLEDTDYCQRTINAGYKILYVGSSRIYHKVFSTTSKNNALLPIYYSTRNRLYFTKKNNGIYLFTIVLYLFFVFSIKAALNRFNEKFIAVTLQSFKDFFMNNMGQTNYFDN